MVATAVADAGFLVALLSRRDSHHTWAAEQVRRLPPPWQTCEAVLSEAFFVLHGRGTPALSQLLRRGTLEIAFDLGRQLEPTLALMRKYSDVPMSLADACLVRMTEMLPDPIVLTTDSDFRVYRRQSRRVVPCAMPG